MADLQSTQAETGAKNSPHSRFGAWGWVALAIFVVAAAAAGYLLTADQAQAVVVGKKVAASQRISMDNIDHSAWSDLLAKYVDDDGMVDYQAWHDSPEDNAQLDSYLNHLSPANPQAEASSEAKLAFWINAYNAVTVKGILREYPTSSIKNHTPLIGYNIWKDLLLQVGDEQISLEDIEHKKLRKMNEPRIHFAIVCASISCPRLLNEAYTADKLDEQLTRNAQDFFSRERNFRFDQQAGTIYLSSILKWYGEDFGATQAEQLQAIAPYLPSDEARRAATSGNVKVKYLDYNWNLNDQATEQ